MLRESGEIAAEYGDCVRIADHSGVWKMVDNYVEAWDSFRDLKESADEARIGVCAFQHKAGFGESPQAIHEVRSGDVGEKVAIPQIAIADSEEQPVSAETLEFGAIGLVGGIEVADDSEDEWMRRSEVEKPIIVSVKRTAFDCDAAGDTKGVGQGFQPGR